MCDDKKISLTILAENITSSRAFIKNIHTKKEICNGYGKDYPVYGR